MSGRGCLADEREKSARKSGPPPASSHKFSVFPGRVGRKTGSRVIYDVTALGCPFVDSVLRAYFGGPRCRPPRAFPGRGKEEGTRKFVPKAPPAYTASSARGTANNISNVQQKARLKTRNFVWPSWPSVNDVLHRLLKAVSSTASSTGDTRIQLEGC